MKNLDDCGNPLAPGYTFRGFTIPSYMLEAIHQYIHKGDPPGDFLTAVITNDLREAIARADDHNQVNLPAYIAFLHNESPGQCWGSPEKMRDWMEYKRSHIMKAA
jgi:hypothetical protein